MCEDASSAAAVSGQASNTSDDLDGIEGECDGNFMGANSYAPFMWIAAGAPFQ
jgi:hypothetical protein